MVKYFIAIPTGPHMPAHTSISLANLTAELKAKGIEYATSFEIGNCHVDDARNILVSRFDRSDATHLIFIDSDIVFKPEAFFELCDAPGEVVGASYPYKNDSGDFPATFNSTAYPDDETGLVPIDGLPTGFLKISRKAFDALRPHMPWYTLSNEPGVKVTEFFARSIRTGLLRTENGQRIGGDIGFSYDMKIKAGIQCWLAPKIFLGHTGTKTWNGCFYWKQSLLAKGVYPSLRTAFEDNKWDTPQVLEHLLNHWGNQRFSGDTTMLQACVHLLKEHSDKPCLEMGSGLSTVFLGLAAEQAGTHVTSLEQDRAWMGKTWGILDDAKCTKHATVLHVEAKDGGYVVDDEIKNRKYGLVVVDGPRCTVESGGRHQAVEFDADCYLFDDAHRPAIQATIKEVENRGYHSHILGDIAVRPMVVCVRKELTKES